jgi:excisionase family DNA binding protein
MKKAQQLKSADRKWPELVSDVMTVQEVAEYLGCHYSTVYRLIKSKDIPVFHLGTSWRFRRAEIDRWIAKRHAAPFDPQGPRRGRKAK